MLKFSSPLHEATFVKRYKRFFVDAILKSTGETVTAHCPNTGSMKTCYVDDGTIFLSKTDQPNRKLKYTWEYSQIPDGLIGVNTARPNLIAEQGLRENSIKELAGYDTLKREVKYGANSRIDIFLSDSHQKKKPCYVEVKNTTLRIDNHVAFPDGVTERGQKHLNELSKIAQSGDARAVMLFLVNRPDGEFFAPADKIDPTYAKLLTKARDNGVEILVYRAISTLNGSTIGKPLKIKLN